MLRRTWITIPSVAAGVLLALLAGARDTRGAQASLDELLQADGMTQEEMAVELLRALDGAELAPRDCVPGEEMFDDVPASSPFCPFIEELARRNITTGCGGNNFCPGAPVTRAQMATFVVKALQVARRFSPRAYGQVFWTGSVHQGRNLSSSNVTHPEEGVYCISGLPFTPVNAVVSNNAVYNAGEKDVRVYVIGTVGGGEVCGTGNQIRIHVYSPGTTTLSEGNFNIVIF